jgi:hypothetical protein
MITEKIVERDAKGRMARVIERTLSPAEEWFEFIWPRVKAGLVSMPEREVVTFYLPPGGFNELVDRLSERIAAEALVVKFKRLRFEVAG